MLTAIGPGVYRLQDYTGRAPADQIEIQSQQGDTLDTCKVFINDPLSAATICTEDDIILLDENDPNGWPTVNLLQNPSFEPPYTGGVAQSWGKPSIVGFTASQNSSVFASGFNSQQLSWNNVANGTFWYFAQNLTMPTDENGNVIRQFPYTGSLYYCVTSALTNVGTPSLNIEWWTANFGTHISSSSFLLDGTAYKNWRRASVSGIAPANAACFKLTITGTTQSATNSGTILLDGAQLEYDTHYNVLGAAYPVSQFYNGAMSARGSGASTCDQWLPDYTPSGATYSTVSSPVLSTNAQKIALTNVAQSFTTVAVAQDRIPINWGENYTVSAQYQVTANLTATNGGNVQARVGVNLFSFDGTNFNYVGNVDARGTPGEVVSGGWETIAFRLGPGTPNPMPSNVTHIKIYTGLLVNDGGGGTTTGSGAVVIGSVSITPDSSYAQPGTSVTSAGRAAMYPTPYCDGYMPGTYYDNGFGVYYRQSRLFGGFIRNAIYDYTNGPERWIECDGVDYGVMLAEAPATLIIQHQPDNNAIKMACDYAANQGYLDGLDYTSYVQNIATVDDMLFNWRTTRDVLSQISNQTVAAYWVDYYKRLHYAPALAITAPFTLSDNPDNVTSFAMTALKFTTDSTQAVTEPIIEGSTQLSAPQSYTNNGYQSTLSGQMLAGTQQSAIPATAANAQISVDSIIQIGNDGNAYQVKVSATTGANATSIPINNYTPTVTYPAGTPIFVVGYEINNANPVAQIDSANPGTGQVTVGIASTNNYAQGYGALIDLQAGVLYFQTAPTTGATVTVVYRVAAPVMVRLHAPWATNRTTGTVRRKIHHHTQQPHISSQQSAIDRANTEISISARAKPVGEITLWSPPTPFDAQLRSGMAISVTHQGAKLSNVLFQIQEVTTKPLGNGIVQRDLKVGFYRPDFVVYMAQQLREQDMSNDGSNTVLQDVLTASDAWAMTDNVTRSVSNAYAWGPSGTQVGVWAPNAGSGVWG